MMNHKNLTQKSLLRPLDDRRSSLRARHHSRGRYMKRERSGLTGYNFDASLLGDRERSLRDSQSVAWVGKLCDHGNYLQRT